MPILAAAGRRIDLIGRELPEFSYEHVNIVSDQILNVVTAIRPERVIASGACGADILVLEAARTLGIPYRIVLPFPPAEFRKTRVVVCGDNWGARFDQLLWHLSPSSEIVVLGGVDDASSGVVEFDTRVTDAILEAAASLGGGDVVALVVCSKPPAGLVDDPIGAFWRGATARVWPVIHVSTTTRG